MLTKIIKIALKEISSLSIQINLETNSDIDLHFSAKDEGVRIEIYSKGWTLSDRADFTKSVSFLDTDRFTLDQLAEVKCQLLYILNYSEIKK